jgi:predicted ester cyclase
LDDLETNKRLVRDFFEAIYNRGEYHRVREFLTEEYANHNGLGFSVMSPDDIARIAEMQRTAFPDLHSTLDDLVAEGDRVVVRGHDDATHLGEFLGYPPTGKPVRFTWLDMFRVQDGRLAESWMETDSDAMYRQLRGE